MNSREFLSEFKNSQEFSPAMQHITIPGNSWWPCTLRYITWLNECRTLRYMVVACHRHRNHGARLLVLFTYVEYFDM